MNGQSRAAIASVAVFLLVTCASERRTKPPCADVCGRVVDGKSGEPVPRFTIAVFSADGDTPRPEYALPAGYPGMPGPFLHSKTIESRDGSFEVQRGPARLVFLEVGAAGFRPARTDAISAIGQPVEIKLVEARKIAGIVVDEQGRPVADALLFHDRPRETVSDVVAYYAGVAPVARSDDRGGLEIDEPFLDEQHLLILKPSFFPSRVQIRKADDRFRVLLRSGVSLEGTVADGTGVALTGAVVEARCEGSAPVRTFSRTDGSFHFDVLPRSRCQFLAARSLREQDAEIVLDSNRGFAEADLTGGTPSVRISIP